MRPLTHGSLFAGVGGFDLGFEWAGIETIWQVEIDEYCRRLLELRFPGAKRYADIRAFAASNSRLQRQEESEIESAGIEQYCAPTPDIISGGFPCQPVSHAGKRQGANDDRYLWPEMFRVVRALRPRWVVAENVYGLITHEGGELLDQVYDDLEGEGYETLPPIVLPACAFGAPHRRDRVWIVAHCQQSGLQRYGGDGPGRNQPGRINQNANGSACEGGLCNPAESGIPHRSGIALGEPRQNPLPERSDWWATKSDLGGNFDGLSRWLDGLDAWGEGWEDGVPRVAKGIPDRVATLRGLGNAIVPEIACLIGRLIMECESCQR